MDVSRGDNRSEGWQHSHAPGVSMSPGTKPRTAGARPQSTTTPWCPNARPSRKKPSGCAVPVALPVLQPKGRKRPRREEGDGLGVRLDLEPVLEPVPAETKVIKSFTEHDLRAKAGSDASSLEKARALLLHSDSRTTHVIYRRKPERVW